MMAQFYRVFTRKRVRELPLAKACAYTVAVVSRGNHAI